MTRLFFLLFVMSFFIDSAVATTLWQYPVINFSRHNYNSGTQNWMIEQQDNGWIYVANNKGLLEYDGVSWMTYPVDGHKLRALKKASNNKIYVGGISLFGYFDFGETDNNGQKEIMPKYVSIMDQLNFSPHIGVVRNIWIGDDRVYFQDDRYMIQTKNDSISGIVDCGSIQSSILFNQKLYVINDKGLFLIKDTELQPCLDAEKVASLSIVMILPYRNDLLLVSRGDGIFLWNATEGLRNIPTPLDSFLKHNDVACAAINGMTIAIGTIQDGIGIIRLDGNESEVISTEEGLQNKSVLGLRFDLDGNLWAALDNGIDYIALTSPLRHLYGNRGEIGSGYASIVFGGKLYMVTNRGIYRSPLSNEQNLDNRIEYVEGTSGQGWQFLIHDNKLFCASNQGVFVIEKEGRATLLKGCTGARQIATIPGWPNYLVVGCYGVGRGLYLLQKRGETWEINRKIINSEMSCKSLIADPKERGVVWFANKGNGVFKFHLSEDLSRVDSITNYTKNLIPQYHDFQLSIMDETVAVASHFGIWTYNRQKDILEHADRIEKIATSSNHSFSFFKIDEYNNMWYSDCNAIHFVHYDSQRNKYSDSYSYLSGEMISDFEDVSISSYQAVIASESGFSALNLYNLSSTTQLRPTNLSIRRIFVTTPTDSLIYNNRYNGQPHEDITIPFFSNSLRFECAAINFTRFHPTQYSYRLDKDGKEGIWSNYNSSVIKEFTNLHEGKYIFHVRALTDNYEAVEKNIAFCILPPWYRSWWSYLAYFLIFVSIVSYIYLLIKRSRKKLVRSQEAKLLSVEEAYREEADRMGQEINTLKEENLQAEFKRQSEELTQATLNLVRKNEMLLNLKKDVLNAYKAIGESDVTTLRRRLLRLISEIEKNISHDDDLNRVQTSFDHVHNGFFLNLEKGHPTLSKKEKMLCAYIVMDLLSKEIAPLMNISLRGVEVSRYRLRKKLGIGDGENLVDYLGQFK